MVTPVKTNMTLENPPFEDVFPIESRDFPMSCFFFPRGVIGSWNYQGVPWGGSLILCMKGGTSADSMIG